MDGIRVPYPFQWGAPVFRVSHVFAMMGAALVSAAELANTEEYIEGQFTGNRGEILICGACAPCPVIEMISYACGETHFERNLIHEGFSVENLHTRFMRFRFSFYKKRKQFSRFNGNDRNIMKFHYISADSPRVASLWVVRFHEMQRWEEG